MTLYDLLGLPRDAAPEEIRGAYRSMAKTHHPDAGGNAERFAAIRRAHDILIDPERRARYDRTGEEVPVEADNGFAQILTFLTGAFEDACMSVQKTAEKLEEVDLIQRMTAQVRHRQQELGDQILTAERDADRIHGLAARFSTRDGSPNYLEATVLGKERLARDFAAKTRKDIEVLDQVAELLSVYVYRANPPRIGREYRSQDPWFAQASELQAGILGRTNPLTGQGQPPK